MTWSLSFAVSVLALSALLAVVFALRVWRRPIPGKVWLALLLLAVAEWEILLALEDAAVDLSIKVACAKLEYFGIAAVPPLWFLFARVFSGRGRPLTRRAHALLWMGPALTVGLALTNERHHLIWHAITRSALTPGASLIYHHGVGFWLAVVYNYILVFGGTRLLLQSVARFPRFYRGQVAVLLAAAVMPLLGNVIYVLGIGPIRGLDLTPFAFSLSGVLLYWSVIHARVLALAPIARETVFANMLDGVAVIDHAGYVVDCNAAAQRFLDGAGASLIGRDARSIFTGAPAALTLLDDVAHGPLEMQAPGDASIGVEVRAVALPVPAHGAGGTILLLRDITERQRAEATLRASEESFRNLFEQAAVGLTLCALDGRFMRANDRLCALLGYTREELMARCWQDVTPHDDVARDQAEIGRLLNAPGSVYAADKRYMRRDGSILWGHLTLSVQRDASGVPRSLMAVVEDCTARIQAETAARASAARYRSMFETNRAIKLVVDMESGAILDANPAACEFYGYGREAMTGMNIEEINVQPVADVRIAMEQAAREHRLSFIAPHRLASGEVRDVEVYSGPVEVDGQTVLYSIIHDVTERTVAEAALHHQALHDALTGLPNRTLLHDRLNQALAPVTGESPQLALLLLDLDRFKEINDTFGHHQGDQLLQAVAQRLRAVLRTSDTVARLGGDEFAVLLPDADEQGAVLTARKVGVALEAPYALAGQTLHVGSSIGIALVPEHGDDSHTVLKRADVAMYAAKRAHRGYAVYETSHERSSVQTLALLGDLRTAITRGELALEYQPKVEMATGRVCGMEALVRWPHPTHGLIPPDRFIPLAEQTGLIAPLTQWVLEAALAQCRAWRHAGREMGVAVNLSTWNLHDAQFVDTVARLLTVYGVPPALLTLELTESAVMADAARALEVLTGLRAVGVRVAVDDFGTGYSSLAYLKRLPVDELKIDRSFVREMARDATDGAIVAAMMGLAHILGLTVVAEGVEDTATYTTLQRMGCDHVQGYYLARPMPAHDLDRWLQDRAERQQSLSSA